MPRSVLLVRHGQASFGKSDYDRLSPLGHEQARLLGRSLAERDWRPRRLVSGGMRRHRESAAEIAIGAGWDLEQIVDDRWNEIDHMAVLAAFKPAYRSMLLLKADMARTLRPRAAFEAMFVAAVERWAGGEHDADYPETFAEFDTRVHAALADLAADPVPTLVVSSVGVIAHLVAGLLQAGDETAKVLTLAAYNTGVTRLSLEKSGPRLLTFNEIGHLPQSRLVTNH